MTLTEYLEHDTHRRWKWGELDCTLFVCDWVFTHCGKDPARQYRGRYSTAAGALNILNKHGGIVSWAAKTMIDCGWSAVLEPASCDVGVVLAPLAPDGRLGPLPAIRFGKLWVVRTEKGQRASEKFETMVIWRMD